VLVEVDELDAIPPVPPLLVLDPPHWQAPYDLPSGAHTWKPAHASSPTHPLESPGTQLSVGPLEHPSHPVAASTSVAENEAPRPVPAALRRIFMSALLTPPGWLPRRRKPFTAPNRHPERERLQPALRAGRWVSRPVLCCACGKDAPGAPRLPSVNDDPGTRNIKSPEACALTPTAKNSQRRARNAS
jgi:hypothetical protein